MLAALLGALSLFAAAPVAAQTTIWSATLTVKITTTGLGCDNNLGGFECSSTNVLSDDHFTHDGVSYEIVKVDLNTTDIPGRLSLLANKAIPASLKAVATLHVGSSQFPLTTASGTNNQLNWDNSGLSWTVDDTVSLSLVEPATPTVTEEYTVTLTADPNDLRPPEGSTVTLTATLDNPAPAGGATLHFIKVTGSAHSGRDFTWSEPGGGPTITKDISINEGETTFTATLKVEVDTETEEDETIDIKVGSSLTLTNNPTLTLTIPANTGRTDNTPTDDTPTDRQPSPTVSVPTTGGGSPPAEPSDPDSPLCGENNREDLVGFYETSGGDNWHENENWNSEKPLDQWFGVKTDEDGSVISLRLPENNLSGDMPTEELQCLTELVELALWGNDDLSGEVPEKFVLAVERAALRYLAETLDINPEWFEDYKDPFNFEDWHTGVTTDDEGRVTGLDFTGEGIEGEIPESVSELRRLRVIETGCGITLEVEAPEGVSVMMPDDCETEASGDGGCALSPEGSSAFGLFLMTLLVFAVLGRTRARG